MELTLISLRRSASCARQLRLILATLLLALASASVSAQTFQLSPTQQQMLNQLPPAQRQQAMDAIRQAQSQQSAAAQQPVQPLREESDEEESLADEEESLADEEESEEPSASTPKPFGYDLFESNEAGFDPPMTGPVPPDYVLGPSDTVRVQLFGNVNNIYEYDVTRDGILNVAELGPVNVAGIPFSEFRADISRRVKEMLIGTQVSVTMGQLRAIRIFVLGDVNRPGSFVVSGLATISSALYRSGGISRVGSLRDVQLKRNGQTVATLDLYDLLLYGDTSDDRRLQPGDVIFVPTLGNTVSIGGAVKRPAIYETRAGATIADVVAIAGGLTDDAFGQGAELQRIDTDRERKILSVDLTNSAASQEPVRAGDSLVIPQVLPRLEETVMLSGHVHRPGNYQWRQGMWLTDLITTVEELQPNADTHYVLIRREQAPNESIEVFSVDLANALVSPGSAADIVLESRDTVNVFSRADGAYTYDPDNALPAFSMPGSREDVITPILDELRLHVTHDAPFAMVQIDGPVRAAGVYPLETEMRVSDLIRAGGGLSEEAYGFNAELTRYSVASGVGRETEFVNIDLDAIRRGDENADVVLKEHDYLAIKRIPEWDSIWTVTLEGEIVFPGSYRVWRGETLADVIQRAGGLTPDAFPEGAVFLREYLKEKEEEKIDTLTRRMETDIASIRYEIATSLQADSGDGDSLQTAQVLLENLKNTEAVGRLVITLQNDVARSVGSIEVRDGDRLLIPTASQVVTVLGETQQNSSHLYQSGLSRDEYIDLSGGLTRRADKKLIYIVRANGALIIRKRRWFGRARGMEIRPGDTIVVPLETNPISPLSLWTSVTQILYQSAIGLAALNTFKR